MEFPGRGGANGSIRFYPEITHNANAGSLLVHSSLLSDLSDKKNHQLCAPLGLLACIPWFSQPRLYSRLTHSFPTLTGLTSALEFLKAVADKYDRVGYADLFQLASATGIEASVVICCDLL